MATAHSEACAGSLASEQKAASIRLHGIVCWRHMRVIHSSFTRKGPNHPVNQDRVLEPVSSGQEVLFGIADGLGGTAGGELASSRAVIIARDTFQRDPAIALAALFEEIRKGIAASASTAPQLADMATTFTVCRLSEDKATVGHIGDARLYHLHNGTLTLRTKDQTEAQRLLDAGLLAEEQMASYARRNILLSVLGATSSYDFFSESFEVYPGDRLIFLTDGAYHSITDNEIAALSAEADTMESLKKKIEKRAASRRPNDDYTALCVEVV